MAMNYKISDCLVKVIDNRGKTPPYSKTYDDYELIETASLAVEQKFPDYSKIKKWVNKDTYDNWFRTGHPEIGDLLISTVGSIGYTALMNENRGCIAQNLVGLRTNKDVLNPDYFCYLLNSYEIRQTLLNMDIGVAQPSIKVPHILDLKLDLPEIETQIKISTMLSNYDNLIENNSRRIKILEEMAQAIYTEWFVNFRFPGHENVKSVDSEFGKVPENWAVKNFTDFVKVNPKYKPISGNKAYFEMADININTLIVNPSSATRTNNSGAKFTNRDTIFPRISPSLENGKGGYVLGLSDSEVALGSTEFIVFHSPENFREYTYLLSRDETFRNNAVKSMVGASGRQRVQNECFNTYKIVIPITEVISQFSAIVSPMFHYAYSLRDKNIFLAKTRDLLIPKLISGEIDVSELDIDVKEEL